MNVRYRVTLSSEERTQLQALVQGGKAPVRRLKRAQVLLAADCKSSDEQIAVNVSVTDRRAASDFAQCMRDLVDRHYPRAERIRVVMDNLSTHTPAALYETFEPAEARRILRRLEFHYTPKHASWLNMVEIEIGVMVGQCLDRRIPDKPTLVAEVAAWQRRRNREKARVNWLFTVQRAREKLGRAYPTLQRRSSPRAAA